MRNILLSLSLCAGASAISTASLACDPGYYDTGAHICLPNSGFLTNSVVAASGLPDLINVGGALVHGNVAAMTQSIGNLIINTQCPICHPLGDGVISQHDQVFLEQVIGKGFMLILESAPTIFITADVVANTVSEWVLQPPDPGNPLESPPPPAARKTKTYAVTPAGCALKSNGGKVTVGWADEPSLTDMHMDAGPGLHPAGPWTPLLETDLETGDIVSVSAADCPKFNTANQTSVGQVELEYTDTHVISRPPSAPATRFRYVIEGSFHAFGARLAHFSFPDLNNQDSLPNLVFYAGPNGAAYVNGRFERKPNGKWLEKNTQTGAYSFTYQLVSANGPEIVLGDNSRNIEVIINTMLDTVGYRPAGGGDWKWIYVISSVER